MTNPHSSANPSIGDSRRTETRSTKIFLDWLPDDWLPRRQDPDLFVDYLVETVETGEPSGKNFAAQIKGTTPGKKRDKTMSYSARVKHARYWLEKCRNPVFVFLIDTVNGTGHWLFVQKFLREEVTQAALNHQQRVTLRFRTEDNLANFDRFRSALESAEKYVRNLHPGSPAAAMEKLIRDHEQKEPRMSYHATATTEGVSIHAAAKVPFKVNLQLKREHAGEIRSSMKEAMEHGRSVTFGMNQISFSGSALFEEFNDRSDATFKLEFGEEVPGSIVFQFPNAKPASFLSIEGTSRCGTKSATFRGSLRDAPVVVECVLEYPEPKAEVTISCSFEWELERWHGQPLLDLSYFEQTLLLLQELASRGAVETELFAKGNLLARGRLSGIQDDWTKEVCEVAGWLERARTVARHYRVNPALPNLKRTTNQEWDAVNDMAALLPTGKAMFREKPFSSTITLTSREDVPTDLPASGCARFDNPNATYEMFGTTIPLGGLRLMFTNVTMEALPSSPDGRRAIKISGCDSTMRFLERF